MAADTWSKVFQGGVLTSFKLWDTSSGTPVLEYTETPQPNKVEEREQHYIALLGPESVELQEVG